MKKGPARYLPKFSFHKLLRANPTKIVNPKPLVRENLKRFVHIFPTRHNCYARHSASRHRPTRSWCRPRAGLSISRRPRQQRSDQNHVDRATIILQTPPPGAQLRRPRDTAGHCCSRRAHRRTSLGRHGPCTADRSRRQWRAARRIPAFAQTVQGRTPAAALARRPDRLGLAPSPRALRGKTRILAADEPPLPQAISQSIARGAPRGRHA